MTTPASLRLEATMDDSSYYTFLLSRVIERKAAVAQFEHFLRSETVWETAPASSRFHLSRPGGLIKHSLNVVKTQLQLREALAPDISEESCVIVGLYHDVGKVGSPGNPLYLPNPDANQAKAKQASYVYNRSLPHIDIPSRSLMLVSRYIPLSDEEAQAIRYHDGQYIEANKSVANQEMPLTRLLQYADNWACGVLEHDQAAR